jgi:hypothetical protein
VGADRVEEKAMDAVVEVPNIDERVDRGRSLGC